MFKEMNVKAAE